MATPSYRNEFRCLQYRFKWTFWHGYSDLDDHHRAESMRDLY
jgi:hypothetical protein